MNVLHVVDSDERRGGEVFAADLVRALDQRIGQRVFLLRRHDGPTRVRFDATTVAPTVPQGWDARARDVRAAARLRREIASWKPDIVQSHGGDSVKIVAAASVGAKTRVIHRWIGAPSPKITRGVGRVGAAAILSTGSATVAVSDAVRCQILDRFWLPIDRVVTIPNAVDPARVRVDRPRDLVRKDLSVPEDAPLVISIGALTWEKDPLRHLAVTSRLLDPVPGLVHVFVGDGPLEDRVRSAVDESGRGDGVRVLGSRDDVPDLLNAADVLLLASRIEGMPGVAIEAACLGVPVVGYAVAGTAEVVVDGVTGSLARPGDEVVLAERLGALLMDPSLRHQMGLEARRRAEGFAIDGVADRYLEVYERVLAGADLCVARGGAVMQEAFRDRTSSGDPFPGMVSVVIPVRNGADVLPQQLEALSRQTYGGAWEVVVADHGSTDNTAEVARGWSDRLCLRVVEVPTRPGAATGFPRSVGAAEALGDLIVTCDADDEATPSWLEELVRAAREHDVVRGSLDRRTLNDRGMASSPFEVEAAAPVPDSAFLPFASTSNCAVRTSVFREIGAWHDAFHSEDKEFSWRAQLAGFDLAVAPAAVMRKRDRATAWASARQSFHYGASGVQLFRAFRDRGMPRSDVRRAAIEWGQVVFGCPLVLSSRWRTSWLRLLAFRYGRLVGCVRHRAFYP